MEFTLRSDTFYVNGLYYYRNTDTAAIKRALFYPFPENPSMGEVGTIKARNLRINTGKDLILRSDRKGAMLGLEVAPKDTAVLQVQYSQKIFGNQAEYIITTTKNWGRPMDIANYILRVPGDKYIIDSLSYTPDTCFHPTGEDVYVFSKRNFMPERNIIVYFRMVN
jgi:hypothetical protein